MDKRDIRTTVIEMARQARAASRPLASIPAPVKDRVLLRTAEALLAQRKVIVGQNELDLAAGRAKGCPLPCWTGWP
jgi:glutamate-5-semialdehyde dehydrogenase